MDELEQEWVQLISEAKEIGLNIEEIREFLRCRLHETKVESMLALALE
ncbi:anti-repressor SinI family protein [Fredinandcohnia quinoae]|uniref:Anti-repressor SinI family protein n=1 Tax=Fredinandcohnia quinoae TaxID=2918902 RepID=A0AAW5EBR2_9BACI|nr:anti-repressor SinI family protein [Fredinandcohnia sp. SECRCQ15]MCH1627486.1 anti-repressor SinI family protein [Fredinandcohnia sp. SECRCQ15]